MIKIRSLSKRKKMNLMSVDTIWVPTKKMTWFSYYMYFKMQQPKNWADMDIIKRENLIYLDHLFVLSLFSVINQYERRYHWCTSIKPKFLIIVNIIGKLLAQCLMLNNSGIVTKSSSFCSLFSILHSNSANCIWAIPSLMYPSGKKIWNYKTHLGECSCPMFEVSRNVRVWKIFRLMG